MAAVRRRLMSERDTLARTFAGLHGKDLSGPRRGLRLGAAPVTALLVLAVWLLTIAAAGWSHGAWSLRSPKVW